MCSEGEYIGIAKLLTSDHDCFTVKQACRVHLLHVRITRFPMPSDSLILSGSSVVGIAGLTFLTFAVVSFTEMRRKIDEQVSRGEDPYELQVDKVPPQISGPEKKKKKTKKKYQSKRKQKGK